MERGKVVPSKLMHGLNNSMEHGMGKAAAWRLALRDPTDSVVGWVKQCAP